MKCHSPNCTGEYEPQEISHSVVYQERTVTIHNVPADICPDCGDLVIAEETTLYLGDLLGRKGRSKGTEFRYEA
ncbi:MAG TPA: YgiT-type zinc finger protein [Thermoanaerobaculia bacterium]